MPPLNTFSRSCLALAISQTMLAPANAATIVVNDSGDEGSAETCTLRQAIVSANDDAKGTSNCAAGVATDTITFDSSVVNGGTVSLTQAASITVTEALVINGPSNASVAINGMDNAGVFYIFSATVSLNNLTITGGSANDNGVYSGGGIYAYLSIVNLSNSTVSGNSAGDKGGGILTDNSSVSLSNSTVSDNSAAVRGGGIYAYSSSVNFSHSTVSGNSAAVNGGGIRATAGSSISLSNSTVSGNLATTRGGGISAKSSNVTLTNSTVSDNTAGSEGGGIFVINPTGVSLMNSLIAGNHAANGAEITNFGSLTFTTDYNLLGDNSETNEQAFSNFTPSGSDITATKNGKQTTALSSILEPLAENGGATKTHALVVGSPAIDAGDNAICAVFPINNLDQRGINRPIGDACDIGSYELDDSSFFVVPLANGKSVIFSL